MLGAKPGIAVDVANVAFFERAAPPVVCHRNETAMHVSAVHRNNAKQHEATKGTEAHPSEGENCNKIRAQSLSEKKCGTANNVT